jgi:hypothetical protein
MTQNKPPPRRLLQGMKEMIKANELRIGNWINLSPHEGIESFGKVLSIGQEEQEYEQVYCECKESFEWAFKDNYRGIPLSPEILSKAGFKNDMIENPYFSGYSIDIGRGREIAVSNPGTPNEMVFLNEIEDSGERKVIVIRNFDYDGKTYLHTLMNIYHALTGTEIDVEL